MTRSELIQALARRPSWTPDETVTRAVQVLLDQMSEALSKGERIEIRGVGSFSLHYRPPRVGRNPETGAPVSVRGQYVPHFKPGKELRERVNGARRSGKAATLAEPEPEVAGDTAFG